jgi:hypothetical protein
MHTDIYGILCMGMVTTRGARRAAWCGIMATVPLAVLTGEDVKKGRHVSLAHTARAVVSMHTSDMHRCAHTHHTRAHTHLCNTCFDSNKNLVTARRRSQVSLENHQRPVLEHRRPHDTLAIDPRARRSPLVVLGVPMFPIICMWDWSTWLTFQFPGRRRLGLHDAALEGVSRGWCYQRTSELLVTTRFSPQSPAVK